MTIKSKALFLMLGLALGANKANSQSAKESVKETDSVFVVEKKDEMTDKVYYFPSRKMICLSSDKNQGFGISFFIEKDKDNDLIATDMDVRIVGVGSCQENDEVIFLLEDEDKITAKMWNKFNCDGNAWFKLDFTDKQKLASKKVLKIRIQNGRTYDTYTHTVEAKNQDYFIQLFYALKNNKIKTKK